MSAGVKKPTSSSKQLAGSNTQTTRASVTVLVALDRIAAALERSNEIALLQDSNLNDIGVALMHLNHA